MNLPKELGTKIRAEAKARGLSITDYVGGILAEHNGMDYESCYAVDPAQEELALTA